jgi:hypothetical protein
MAQFTVDVPDSLVDRLVAALAQYEGVSAPTTEAGKISLAQAFCKDRLKEVLVNHTSQQASQSARANQSDPAVRW